MKNIIEGYIGLWVVMILLYICLAFTSINMNVNNAKNILTTMKSSVSASNGSIVDSTTNKYSYDSSSDNITIANNGYTFTVDITRQSLYTDSDGNSIYDDATKDNTFQYNNIYKVVLKYHYSVPLFGEQVYPISTIVY